MAITPSGHAAWTRETSHEDYGGNVDKQNYLSRGAIDALTDVTAENVCRIAADLEAVVRTVPFCTMSVTCNDATCAAPTIASVLMQTGVRTTSYAGDVAPTGYPSGARVSDGVVTITFASSYSDEYSVAGDFAPTHAVAFGVGTEATVCSCSAVGPLVHVYCWDGSGSPMVAMPDASFTLSVW